MSEDELWWNQVHGAQQLKYELLNVLLSLNRSAWIGKDIPWEKTLREQMKASLSERDGRTHVTFLSAAEIHGRKPEDIVFQLDSELKRYYMPGKPLAEYICERKRLETHVIWLYDLDVELHGEWFEFSRDLGRLKAGLRVVCHGNVGNERYPNIKLLHAKEYFTELDRLLFSMLLSSRSNASTELQMYYSYLAVGIAGERLELIPALLKGPKQLAADPDGYIRGLGINTDSLDQIIHKAQVKVVLPKIEDEQERMVDELSSQLKDLLPFGDEYEKKVEKLRHIELRHMYYLHQTKKLRLTEREEKRLSHLRELRNQVAHQELIEGDIVIEFLS